MQQSLAPAPAVHPPLATIQDRLRAFDFTGLFNELGWDYLPGTSLAVTVAGRAYQYQGIAEKRGFHVFVFAAPEGESIPDSASRRALDRAVTQLAREHLLIFVDASRTQQVWHVSTRQPGEPQRAHEYVFRRGQSGQQLAQRLAALTIGIDEDNESLTVLDVAGRVRGGLAAERVTRRFYDRFRQEHEAFRGFVSGIEEATDRAWYASLMLNRLMFIYFIQKKGFLNGDIDYLRHKLAEVRATTGEGHFLSFYRHFLQRLFHEGLSKQPHERPATIGALIGKVPYLNGGLFDLHDLERQYPLIDIPDQAFEMLFAFFDQYRWHLDERPLGNDNEINPDVLGYIFEKYINQKQMGAYYTKEDITEYIGKNTIIPAILDRAKADCAVAFRPDGAMWRLLRDDPDRYIYPAVRHGADLPLPPDIAAGVRDVSQRASWNQPAAEGYALPTETWREHVARRQRFEDLWLKLAEGEVTSVDDLITHNLDLRQFAQDAIEWCEGPETLRAFWQAIRSLTVLDPTCGSGAFLFAALNILQPLADACLERMRAFVAELGATPPARAHSEKYADFRKTLDLVALHPSQDYFVLKQIVLTNLYGVDIMPEAVEICKLRLFLKLVAQLERADQIEPLPDIDFNIRAGNTLVGFASLTEVKRALSARPAGQHQQLKMIDAETATDLRRMQEEADKTARASARFREMQDDPDTDSAALRTAKHEVRKRLDTLRAELDVLQARLYGVAPDGKEFADWRDSHLPFHWVSEFYDIVRNRGGFDVIVGNPPYVELSRIRSEYSLRDYESIMAGNLYALCIERSYVLLVTSARFGFIVQSPLVSTQRMEAVRRILDRHSSFLAISTFDDRPSKLFAGMHHCRLAIVISKTGESLTRSGRVLTTRYTKWNSEERDRVFDLLHLVPTHVKGNTRIVPKLGSSIEVELFAKVFQQSSCLSALIAPVGPSIYYKITGVGHWFSFTLRPPRFWRAGVQGSSTRENIVSFQTEIARDAAFCCLWSTLHYWLYQATTNCRDLNPSDLQSLPIPSTLLSDAEVFASLSVALSRSLDENAEVNSASYVQTGAVSYERFRPRYAKPIIDEIDRELAKHYGFTDEELDFIINYDIKYRMGQDGSDGEA